MATSIKRGSRHQGLLFWLNGGATVAFDTKESGRRELAEAIVSPDNPLTYRVYANRLWSMFLEGLVPTTSYNFGSLGEPHTLVWTISPIDFDPTGVTKALVREMVLSATYRHASQVSDDHLNKDPSNRWLSRMRAAE